eukprot:479815-Ditylum_brightwellii.AAC.1
MWEKAPIKDNAEATISDHFSREPHRMESAEQTHLTKEKGKWFLLYKVQKAQRVQNFVDNALPCLFSEYVAEEH